MGVGIVSIQFNAVLEILIGPRPIALFPFNVGAGGVSLGERRIYLQSFVSSVSRFPHGFLRRGHSPPPVWNAKQHINIGKPDIGPPERRVPIYFLLVELSTLAPLFPGP